MSEENNIPSASPSQVKVEALAEKLNRLIKVSSEYNIAAGEIAENIFSYLIDITDDELVLSGNIPLPESGTNEYEKIGQYIAPLNRLFSLARGNNGSTKHLDRALLSDKELGDPRAEMMIKIQNNSRVGNELLDILCSIVDQEASDRSPTNSPKVIGATVFAATLNNPHPNSGKSPNHS